MSTNCHDSTRGLATPACLNTGRAGFSLVEMLIGIVITGIVGAAVVGVLLEQNAFYEENSRRVTAQKSLRAAADRMSTELRMVHRGDVQTAEADRIVVRFGVANGIVCHTTGGTAYLYFHRVPDSAPSTVRYLEPRFQGSWQTGLSWGDFSQDGSQTCASHGSPSGKSAPHYRAVSSWPGSTPDVGTIVYGTVTLTYEFDTRNGDLVLLRDGTQLARPFEQSPPYFRYFRENGSELSSPVTGSSLDQIASVQIEATAQGHDPNARFEGDRTISLSVPFRN